MTSCKGKNIFPTNIQRTFQKNHPFNQCSPLPAANISGIWQCLSTRASPGPPSNWATVGDASHAAASFPLRSLTHCLVNSLLTRFHRPHSKCSPRRRYSRRSLLEAAGEGWWMKTLMRGGGNFWRGTEPLPHAADRRGRSG